jgi:hemerythrin-like metal-binding protein
MSYIQWNSSKELGHAVIDREHRELMELVNRLVEALFDPSAEDDATPHVRKQQIADAVDALGRATAEHFASEEAIMMSVGFPMLPEHRVQHASLLAQFDDFAAHFRSPHAGSVALALRFLREWFEYHIEFYDAPMARWIIEQGDVRR